MEDEELVFDDEPIERPELEDFLKELYPKSSKKRIKHYIELINNYDTDKLPETRDSREYKRIDAKVKMWQARQKELKARILKNYQILNHQIGGVNIINTTSRSYDPIKFYNWVSTIISPELLDEITIKTIDEEKFKKLQLKGIIEYDELPAEETGFTKKEGFRVEIEGSRKRKLKE